MASVPTIEEEDANLPIASTKSWFGERTRIFNKMKATLARFAIRGFKPTLRKAPEKHSALRTAEGKPPAAKHARRAFAGMARLRLLREQLKDIEE